MYQSNAGVSLLIPIHSETHPLMHMHFSPSAPPDADPPDCCASSPSLSGILPSALLLPLLLKLPNASLSKPDGPADRAPPALDSAHMSSSSPSAAVSASKAAAALPVLVPGRLLPGWLVPGRLVPGREALRAGV